MAEAITGKNRIILLRALSAQGTENAGRLTFQTEHEKSSSRDSESTATKDGNINALSEEAVEFSISTLLAQEDATRDKIEVAYHKGELVEIWDINRTAPAPESDTENAGKYPATYYQGYITEWNESAPVDGNVELSLSLVINGAGVKGFTELSQEQEEVAMYDFTDTKRTGA